MSRRSRDLHGQRVAFAESTAGKPGDTSLQTIRMTFDGISPASPPGGLDQPLFYPSMKEAEVRLSAVEQVSGSPQATRIEMYQIYIDHRFAAANKGAVFVRTLSPTGVTFPSDKSGGLVTPNMAIGGLSRLFGPVGGDNSGPGNALDTLSGGQFDAAKFFAGVQAKILGGIDLFKIIDGVSDLTSPGGGGRVPQITSQTLYPGGDKHQAPEAIVTTLDWTPKVKDDGTGTFIPRRNGTDATLAVNATLFTKLTGPEQSTFKVVGDLRNFQMSLLGSGSTQFLIIEFNKLVFTAEKGKKANVDVDIAKVTFAGVLEFVNALQNYLKSTGNGPGIDVSPAGITASYSLGLPTVGVGVFTLQNLSLSAGLNIPFTGNPARVRFAFCEREHPAILTVYGIGGGFFFGIALGLDGIELFEAAIEFGASVAIDLGVASGSVHLMAGIYFKMEKDPKTTELDAALTGYLRFGGEVEALGIVSVSIELYMGLTYSNGKAIGQATLTIEVSITFFSASFSISVERKFAGSGPDPTFAELMPPDDPQTPFLSTLWDAYCDAFAPVP